MSNFKTISFSFIFLAALAVGCKKDSKPPKSPGDFVATVAGKPWTPNEYKCYYYPKFNDVYIYAVDPNSQARLEMVAYINPTKPEDKYVFEANGTHSATAYINCTNAYFTDINDNSISGNIELLKFDTVSKKVSARFNYKAYSFGKKEYLTVSGGHFEDIDMIISRDSVNLPYRGSYVQADFNDTTAWFSSTMVFNNHGDVSLEIYANRNELRYYTEPVVNCTIEDNSSRLLYLSIPFDKGLGTFTLYPNNSYYPSQPHIYPLCSYSGREYDDDYMPVSGTVTVTYIDKPTRKIRGNFEMVLKDSSNRTLKITNGKFVCEKWYQ